MERIFKIGKGSARKVADRHFIRLALFVTPFFITVFYIAYVKMESFPIFILKGFNTWYFMGCCLFLYTLFMIYIWYSLHVYYRSYRVELTEDYLLVPQLLRARNGAPYYSITAFVQTDQILMVLSEQRTLTIYNELEDKTQVEQELKGMLPDIPWRTYHVGRDMARIFNLVTVICMLVLVFSNGFIPVLLSGLTGLAGVVSCFVYVVSNRIHYLVTGKIIYSLGLTFVIIALMLLTKLN